MKCKKTLTFSEFINTQFFFFYLNFTFFFGWPSAWDWGFTTTGEKIAFEFEWLRLVAFSLANSILTNCVCTFNFSFTGIQSAQWQRTRDTHKTIKTLIWGQFTSRRRQVTCHLFIFSHLFSLTHRLKNYNLTQQILLLCLRNVPFHVQCEMITATKATLADDAFELWMEREDVFDEDSKIFQHFEFLLAYRLSSCVLSMMSCEFIASSESPFAIGPLARIRLLTCSQSEIAMRKLFAQRFFYVLYALSRERETDSISANFYDDEFAGTLFHLPVWILWWALRWEVLV